MIRKKVVHIAGNVVLYSTGCPKCKILERRLGDKNVEYSENNSVDEMISLGFTELPVLKVGEDMLSFKDALAWVNQQ